MKELKEQHVCMFVCVCVCVCVVCICVCVKFCCKLGKNFTETFQLLKMQSSQWIGKGLLDQKKHG